MGGHKAHLAGGLVNKFESGTMRLTKDYFVFIKTGVGWDKWHGLHANKEEWRISIPLKSIQIEKWHIDEKDRRETFVFGGIPTGVGIFGGGSIDKSGKAHDIVIPYIDENGVPQEPRFGVASIMGKGIKKWAEELYQAVVNAQKDILKVSDKNSQTNEKTDEDPIKILKIRYAKGEITKEEFEQMKKDLS